MKKFNLIRYSLVACMSILLFACQKSEDEISYKPINEIQIKTDTTRYSVAQLDTLKIKPVFTESMPSGEEFIYNWKLYPYTGTVGETVLAETRDLKVQITSKPATYYLRFRAESKKTGIAYFSNVVVEVTSAFSAGWYVSSNTAGKGKVSLIRTTDYVVLPSPLEDVNSVIYPGKAIGVHPAVTSGGQGTLALLYYFTDQGMYRFTINDLLENARNETIIPVAPFKTAPTAFLVEKQGTDQLVIGDGGLHVGFAGNANLFFGAGSSLKPFSERLQGDYNLYPGIFATINASQYYYDNKNKRFMQKAYFSRDLMPSQPTSGAFNMAAVGLTMVAADVGNTSVSSATEHLFLMESSAGQRYLYSLTGSVPTINKIFDAPDINAAKFIAASSITRQLYYATGNKVYVHDIPNLTAATATRLVYTFPAGYVIKDLKIQRSTSKRLVVAADKGTQGEVYFFDIDNLGDLIGGTYTHKFTGFGEIVNVAMR